MNEDCQPERIEVSCEFLLRTPPWRGPRSPVSYLDSRYMVWVMVAVPIPFWFYYELEVLVEGGRIVGLQFPLWSMMYVFWVVFVAIKSVIESREARETFQSASIGQLLTFFAITEDGIEVGVIDRVIETPASAGTQDRILNRVQYSWAVASVQPGANGILIVYIPGGKVEIKAGTFSETDSEKILRHISRSKNTLKP